MSRLDVAGLHYSRGPRQILRDVSLQHDAGAVLSLLGPSGSGKTTLLWLLAGLLRPDRGAVTFVDGSAPQPAPPRIGFVFQDAGLWEHISAAGHLDLVLSGRGLSRADRRARATRLLGDVGLSGRAHHRPGQLSGGERQRLSLARALAVEPQWLLLDEPTSQLDGPSRSELLDLLERELRRTRAGVILATHQVDLAMRLGQHLAVLLDGTIAQSGTLESVYRSPANLRVAQLLGPAFELAGVVRDGQLVVLDVPILRGTPGREGEDVRTILRPHNLVFHADPRGPLVVESCRFAGGTWELAVASAGGRVRMCCASVHPVEPGRMGRCEVVRAENVARS